MVYNHSTIAAHHKVIIENGVLTGPHVFIADYNHEYRDVDKPVWEQGEFAQENSHIIIGEGSWLGTNVVVVGKVRIGKHCVIGANSVVTKDIPDYLWLLVFLQRLSRNMTLKRMNG